MIEINTIKSIFSGARHELEPYIRYIRFPHYKQLSDGERIDFDFPLTVLVGPNGCNKSSVLQAIFGCPEGNSTGFYWFSTEVDVISENSGPHCFIHGYYSDVEGEIVEALKTRINVKKKPDYWEPSRPILRYGMKKVPLSKGEKIEGRTDTRWKAIDKNVVYLDFRAEIGAYDKFFWHGDLHKTETIKSKQDYIRLKSKYLRRAINQNLSSYQYYSKPKIRKNVLLSKAECEVVSNILGQDYSSVRLIVHSFYGNQSGKTVILNRAGLEYSEAFAGSGETSVVVLVQEIMSAPEKSLILLDEPETSLHPKAQEKLLEFLLQQIIKKKHQIVISTHSPTLVSNLPPEAIKVMCIDQVSKKIKILPKSFPEEAFEVIGNTNGTKLMIYVEDALAKVIIDVFIHKFKQELSNSIEVKFVPGGADTIMKNFVSGASVREAKKEIYIFDGDKHYKNRNPMVKEMRDKIQQYTNSDGKINIDTIPLAENGVLDTFVKELVGCGVTTYINGNRVSGGDNEQKYMQLRNFIKYWSEYVYYFPGMQPEELLYSSLTDTDRDQIFNGINLNGVDWKEYYSEKAKNELLKPDIKSEDILLIQRQIVTKFTEDCEVFKLMSNIIGNHFAK